MKRVSGKRRGGGWEEDLLEEDGEEAMEMARLYGFRWCGRFEKVRV